MSIIYEPKGRAAEYSLLACNLYCGCCHGCTYCYAPRTIFVTRNTFTKFTKPRRNIIERLQEDAPEFTNTDKRVLLCFTSDPYQPEEIEQKITRKALMILREFDIPFQILTKGGVRAVRDFDLYGPNDAFATTLTFLDAGLSEKYEPSAPVPGFRILAIKQAKERGIQTWVSLEPVINATQSLTVIERTNDLVDFYKIGKLNYQPSDIDWRKFGIEAIELCEMYEKPYYIKDDLAKYLDGIKYKNTDTRKAAKGI